MQSNHIINNEDISRAWEIIESTNTNLFLTGKAGTGKTTFLRRLREESAKRIVVVAPTGIAAINANGVTIHSFFQLSFAPFIPNAKYKSKEAQNKFGKNKIKMIQSIDTLVIDEISMVRADLLDAVDSVLKRFRKNKLPFGGVQMVMIGDLGQLAPVAKDEDWQMLSRYYDTPYFFSSHALQDTRYAIIELKHVYRQSDKLFVDILNKVRDNLADENTLKVLNSRYIPNFQPNASEGYIRLTTHNAQAQRINDKQLAMLPYEEFTYNAEIKGKYPEMLFPTDQTLHLKKGAQVMFVKNDSSAAKRFYNGMIGTVTAIGSNGFEVMPNGMEMSIDVEMETWENTRYVLDEKTKEITEEVEGTFKQFPVKTAWAITVHKSQGLTFDRAIIDVQFAFTHGQTYVALSRCRTLEGMVLSAPLPRTAIIRDTAVDQYIQEAPAHMPSNEQMQMLQRDYYLSMLIELFDFRTLFNAVSRMTTLLRDHFKRSFPKLIAEYAVRTDAVRKDMLDVAETFKLQYSRMVIANEHYDEDAELQVRLTKGAAYFARKLSDVIGLIDKTTIKTDNKEVKASVNELFGNLKEVAQQKYFLLNHVSNNGFKLSDFLHKRALALAGKTDSTTTPSTQSNEEGNLSATTKATAKTKGTTKGNTDDECMHPEVLKALTEWRRKRAMAANVPAYVIMTTKALVGIANMLPTDKEAMCLIPGMGKVRVEKYGDDILAVLETNTNKTE